MQQTETHDATLNGSLNLDIEEALTITQGNLSTT